METWTILGSAIAVLISVYYFFTRKNFFEQHDVIHVKFSLIEYINSTFVQKKLATQSIKDMYNIHPKARYVGFYDFLRPITLIRDPDLIRSIAVKNFDHFVDRRMFLDSDQEPLFYKNLAGLNGEEWRERRSLLSPAFTSSKMKGMFKLMSDCGENFANFVLNEAKSRAVTYNTKDIFTRYATDVIASCAFGITVDSMKDPTNDFYVLGKQTNIFERSAVYKMLLMKSIPALTKLLGLRILDKKVETFFTEVIRSTVEMRDKEGITRPDMLQLMMETRNNKEHGHVMTISEMTAQAFGFFLGGFDTTTSVMCFVAHHIASDPEIQRKLQEEVAEIYERDKKLTYEGVNRMPYLDAIINEALRIYPIGFALDRVCTKEFQLPPSLPGKKSVPLQPGDCVFFPVYALHMDPNYFPDPERFYPERFIEDPKATLHSPAFFPFGVGPRMCIGNRFALLEIKALIFHLILKCNLKVGSKMIMPMRFSKATFVIAPEGDFWLSMEPRSK